MKTREMERALAAADPVGRERLDGLDFGAMEADLLADVEGERSAFIEPRPARRRAGSRRGLALALGSVTLAAALAAFFVLAGGGSRHSRAYGAEEIRFAESTPLLLLEGPGWRVEDVYEERAREGTQGSMEFVTGKPIPDETIKVTGNLKTGQYETGMAPAAVRQRRVELTWRHGSLQETLAYAHEERLHPHGLHWTEAPVLGTTAHVDTRDEIFVNQGGPGDREMTGYWSEGGYLLELRAAVPDLAGFEERLGWLTKVDSQTWLDAMPAKVVKAADHGAVVHEMLKGIPVPSTFRPSRIPDEGLTTNRDQVADSVTDTVSRLWFRQWGEARRTGDREAELEAEQAMATYKRWPILREEISEGGDPETLMKLVASMPSGIWQFGPHRYRLLPEAEGLGCARLGLPLLPRKMKLQRERDVPPPPN